jgi:hypothetical protein
MSEGDRPLLDKFAIACRILGIERKPVWWRSCYLSLHEIATVSFAERWPEWDLGNSRVPIRSFDAKALRKRMLIYTSKRFNRFRIITAASTHALDVKAQGLLPLDATHPSITRLQSP